MTFTLEQMEEAAELIGCANNIEEWKEVVLADDGPLCGCEIPYSVEEMVINELYREHQDTAQRAMEMFNLRNGLH